jgi:anthranilate phosphoribosyltransferase
VEAYLESICRGGHLTAPEAERLFGTLVAGELEPVQISALLVALKAKGERPAEIAGAAAALRASAAPFPRPASAIADCCGTGGDGAGTINVSTMVALVAAELGIPIAKHGNRSISSRCGSADVLEQLGVRIDAPPAVARRCLEEVGICFLFAPRYHPGLAHAMPVRRTLAVRTIFNLLGPLVNPAAPDYQLLGVYDPALCAPLAATLGMLGCRAALVVHGGGLDEIALHAPTTAALLRDGRVHELELAPEQVGLARYGLDRLAGGAPEHNAAALRALAGGDGAPAHAAAVALNAGALAWVCGAAPELGAGVERAQAALSSGRVADRLARLAEVSHGS